MRPIPSLLLPLFGASLFVTTHAVAQQPTLTTSLLAPLSTSVFFGGAIGGASSVTFPDTFGSGVSGGGAAGANCQLRASAIGSAGLQGVRIQQEVNVNLSGGVVPAQASCDADLLMSLTAAVPMLVVLHVDNEFTGSAGCPLPLVEVDIGFDGTFEYSTSPLAMGAGPGPFSLPLSSVPTLVRVRAQSQTGVDGFGISDLVVRIVPGIPSTWAESASVGCDFTHDSLLGMPRFDGGIDLWIANGLDPVVVVFGLGLQPVLLPANDTLPCLLMPSVDLLLMLPLPTTTLTLPLPPAVRPVTFWAQAVKLPQQGLLVTNAIRVDAL
jgi:hypothetical protein